MLWRHFRKKKWDIFGNNMKNKFEEEILRYHFRVWKFWKKSALSGLGFMLPCYNHKKPTATNNTHPHTHHDYPLVPLKNLLWISISDATVTLWCWGSIWRWTFRRLRFLKPKESCCPVTQRPISKLHGQLKHLIG